LSLIKAFVEKEKQSIAAAEKGKHLKNYQMKLREE